MTLSSFAVAFQKRVFGIPGIDSASFPQPMSGDGGEGRAFIVRMKDGSSVFVSITPYQERPA